MLSKEELCRLLLRHYDESSDGLVDKTPTQLNRGEGTEQDFYVFKLDIVGSTSMLARRHRATYLRFAHTLLSTVDAITQRYGADERQVEYAGDSVQAYFPCHQTEPNALLIVAGYCRFAVNEISNLDATLKQLGLRFRIVIHKGALVVANIGPWGSRQLTAIGWPLHQVGHIEKNVSAGQALVTEAFGKDLLPKVRNQFLSPVYDERQVPIEPSVPPDLLNGLFGLGQSTQYPPQPTQYRTERTLRHWLIAWRPLDTELGLL